MTTFEQKLKERTESLKKCMYSTLHEINASVEETQALAKEVASFVQEVKQEKQAKQKA